MELAKPIIPFGSGSLGWPQCNQISQKKIQERARAGLGISQKPTQFDNMDVLCMKKRVVVVVPVLFRAVHW